MLPDSVQHLPLLKKEPVVFLFEGQTIPSVIVMREIHRVTRRPKSSLRLSRHNGADYTTTEEKKQLAMAGNVAMAGKLWNQKRPFIVAEKDRQTEIYTERNLLYVRSIINAPNGAVIRIAITATVKMILPEDKPIDKGIAPMAA